MSTIHASPLVGRTAEVRALADGLERAASGRPTAVLLTGEAGIGKSRLVEDAVLRGRARGFRVLLARASPVQLDLHFGVLVDVLRPLVREGPTGARTALLDGLPELGRLFEGTGLPAPEPLGDPGLERTRLFETVRELVERASRRQPLLLAVDDVQWADQASLAALEYSLRGLTTARLLLLVTCRSGEGAGRVDQLLAALGRLPGTTDLRLGGLGSDEVAELAAHLLGDTAPDLLLELLADRARGVPMFVRGVIGSLIQRGSLVRTGGRWVLGPVDRLELPGEISALVRSRVDSLPPGARRILEVVAVGGGAVAPAALRAVLPGAEDDVGALLDAGLLAADVDGAAARYRVTHPLLAEVVYQSLPAAGRRETHAAFVRTLRHETADLDLLAHHLGGAGDLVAPGEAREVLARAARRALEMHDGAAAARHAEHALGLVDPAADVEHLRQLLALRAEGLQLAGWTDEARRVWSDAAQASERAGDREARGRCLRRLAQLDWESGHFDDALTHVAESVAVLSTGPPGEELVAALSARVTMLLRGGGSVGPAVAELESVAVRTGSAEGRVRAALARAGLAVQRGTIDAARQEMADVVELAAAAHLPLLGAEVARAQATVELEAGRLARAADIVAKGLAEARRLALPTLEVAFCEVSAVVKIQTGDWDGTMADADRLLQLAHRTGSARGKAYALTARGLVQVYRGNVAAAETSVQEARALYGQDVHTDRHLATIIDVLDSEVLLARHRFREVVDRLHDGQERRPAMAAAAALLAGQALCALGRVDEAAARAAALARFGGAGTWPAALADRLRALVAQKEGDLPGAAGWFARSGETLDALGVPYGAALSWLGWAECSAALGPAGDGVEPESLVRSVSEQVERLQALGAKPAADRGRRLLRSLGQRSAPARAPRLDGPLSARELEIARLVAEGLSNAAIADRLFISLRTVTTHLQHAYARLGVPSRAALAGYVVAHDENGYVERTMPPAASAGGESPP